VNHSSASIPFPPVAFLHARPRQFSPHASVLGQVIIVGLVTGLAYWFVESALHAFVFKTGIFEHELLHGDWNELWMRSCAALLFAGLAGGIQWHRSRMAAWELQLRRYASAVEQSSEAMLITDADGLIEFTNPAFSRLTGYTFDEVRGRNPSVLKSGAHSLEHYRAVWATIKDGRAWSGSVVDRRKDGTYYPTMLTIAPVVDPRGVITHFVGVQHDISHQVELEERIRHTEKVETLGMFAAGIAHDFGNSLMLLSLQMQLATRQLDTNPAEARAGYARMEQLIMDAAARVREISTFARRGATTLTHEPLELSRLLERVHPLTRLMVPPSLLVTLEAPRHEVWVRANASALQQVIVNLVQNARDALNDQPGAVITLSSEYVSNGRAINPQAAHLDRVPCARLCVTDNGPGIKPSLRDQIFEPFFTTKGERGSGLGLALVRETARRHGGALRLVPSDGPGSTFELLLPITSPVVAPTVCTVPATPESPSLYGTRLRPVRASRRVLQAQA